MNTLPAVETDYLLDFMVELLNIPSPTGFAHRAVAHTKAALAAFPSLELCHTRKGALVAEWPGEAADKPRALTAHVDTLGAMVKEVKPNGRLKLSRIGHYAWNTVEGEGCTVFTRDGNSLRGSLLLTKASGHVYGKQVAELRRDSDTMEVRLDAQTHSAADTHELGVGVGDFVAFDPRVEVNNGYVRSRYLDDKACVASLLAAVQAMQVAGLKPSQTTTLLISNYEEVGHGAAFGIPAGVTELVTLDMAAVGEGQTSDEHHATLCVKDSGGPYHHGFNQRLRALADQHAIPYKVDIYPYYISDGEATWRAGGDLAVALLGPGVDASHNYERTHLDALVATARWIVAYLVS